MKIYNFAFFYGLFTVMLKIVDFITTIIAIQSPDVFEGNPLVNNYPMLSFVIVAIAAIMIITGSILIKHFKSYNE